VCPDCHFPGLCWALIQPMEKCFFFREHKLSSPLPPPSPVSKLSLFLRIPVSPVEFTVGRGRLEELGEEPDHTTARKPGSL
jgi:hypothetical protein